MCSWNVLAIMAKPTKMAQMCNYVKQYNFAHRWFHLYGNPLPKWRLFSFMSMYCVKCNIEHKSCCYYANQTFFLAKFIDSIKIISKWLINIYFLGILVATFLQFFWNITIFLYWGILTCSTKCEGISNDFTFMSHLYPNLVKLYMDNQLHHKYEKNLANTYPNDTNVHQYQAGVSCTTMLIEFFAHYNNVISKWHKCATMDHICASSMIKV